jgi:excisionase family DNA binding protein
MLQREPRQTAPSTPHRDKKEGSPKMNDTMTPSQVARQLELSRSRVLQLNNEGRLPAIRTPLGRLFKTDVVERFALERELARA